MDNNVWGARRRRRMRSHRRPARRRRVTPSAVGPRRLTAILCTHAHDDHVDAAAALAEATRAPIWLHPADRELWDQTYPDRAPDRDLADGQVITVAGAYITVLHTPGHSRGAVCFHLPGQRWLFSGDTLFAGGTGRDRAFLLRLARSSTRSATGCSSSIRARSSTPATARTPPSAPNDPTCRNGSPAGTDTVSFRPWARIRCHNCHGTRARGSKTPRQGCLSPRTLIRATAPQIKDHLKTVPWANCQVADGGREAGSGRERRPVDARIVSAHNDGNPFRREAGCGHRKPPPQAATAGIVNANITAGAAMPATPPGHQ